MEVYIINSIAKSYILNIKIRPLVTEYALTIKLVDGTSSAHSFNPYAYFGHSWSYFDIKNLQLIILYLTSRNDTVSNNKLTVILKIIIHCGVKHIMTVLIKTITSVVNVSTFKLQLVRLAAILAIMSVSTFTAAVILYASPKHLKKKYLSINFFYLSSFRI